MAKVEIRVSDLTGRHIEDETKAALVIVEHPDVDEPITLEVLPEEIEQRLPEGDERFVVLSYFAPGESTARRFLLPLGEFNNLFEEQEEEGILDKLKNLLLGQQEEKKTAGRQRRGRRRQAARNRRERIDWASPERAGEPHPGRVSPAEREYVREHLDEVNERLRRQGRREIDPNDPMMAERYGLRQEPTVDVEEAEVIEDRPPEQTTSGR